MKNIKVIGILFVLYVAVLLIMRVVNAIDQTQVLEYGKKGLLIAIILVVLGFVFSAFSPKNT